MCYLLKLHEVCQRVYWYDHETGIADHPEPRKFPWHVLSLLGSIAPKHIFSDGKMPKMSEYGIIILNLRRLITRAFNKTSASIPWWYKKLRRKETLKPKPLDEHNMIADICTHQIQSKVYEVVRRELTSFIGSRRIFKSNMDEFIKYGLRWLQENHWKAVQTDKDGGWCLATMDTIKKCFKTQWTRRNTRRLIMFQ